MTRILKFEKEDCNPCVMTSRYFDSKQVSFESVNPFNNPELAVKYKVRSVPTTILEIEGKEKMRVIGFKPAELDELIQNASAGDNIL